MLLLGLCAASIMAPCKTNTKCYFCFLLFFIEAEILFGVLSISKTGSNVGLL